MLPLLIVLTTTVFQQIFSELANKHLDPIGVAIGNRLLLLICLFLIAGMCSLALFYFSVLTQKDQGVSRSVGHESLPIPDKKQSEKEIRQSHERLLKNLSGGEKRMLQRYFDDDTKTQMFHVSDGGPAGLASRGILFNPSSYVYGVEVSYNISEWAWEMLKENPKYLT